MYLSMKKLSYLTLFFLLLVTFQRQVSAATNQESFTLGESLTYRVHYGWLDAGVATMKVDHQFHNIHGKTCYKIDVAGESKGLLYLFLKMKNEFGSYLDSTALISQASYRYIQEGKYRKTNE
jgi:hypothetical protein